MAAPSRRLLLMGAGGVILATALQTHSFFHRHRPVQTDGKKRHIRLAWPEPDYDPLLWLCQQGIFGRYNLTVDLVETPGGNSAIDAVVNNRADAALSPLLDWLPALYQDEENELPARLACGVRGGSYRLLVRRALNLHKVGNLAGRKIGVVSLEGADRRFVSIQLRRRGLHPTDSVQWVAIPADDMADALRAGDLDAVAVHDPSGWRILQQTKGVSWNMLDSMTGAERERIDLTLGIATKAMAQDPGLAAALTAALQDAQNEFPAHRDELARLWKKDSDAPEEAKGMLDREIASHVVTGHPFRVQVEQYVDELKLIGLMPDADKTTDIAHRICLEV
ncbi:ABC transporter substrate-binding protein [Asaia spathodeae]|uniref:ABC transporter substrate-binding protein n=1 Tax=Asaia spathodeae TaxID=657016 RepID=A0ABX2P5X1_9PROT|nr:ABC transporter substrate-binding protein [Asaia spathodeae]GBR11734.1 nitrate/sulfonate/bicarbonate transporter substrate-binding periplasmic protein [Asaia spathodeae NBRC 105894]